MDEKILPIDGWPHYYISNCGNVYSDKNGTLRPIRTRPDSKARYILVKITVGGKTKHALVHRLVAQAFLPNPNNLSDVHHKDSNPQNNVVSNLEWCTHRDNLHHSYLRYPPARNTNACVLLKYGHPIGSFPSIRAAMRYAMGLGCNVTSLEKYLRCGAYSLQVSKTTRKTVDNKTHKTQNRNTIIVRNGDDVIASCKTCVEASKFLTCFTGKHVSEKMINRAYHSGKLIFNTYSITR